MVSCITLLEAVNINFEHFFFAKDKKKLKLFSPRPQSLKYEESSCLLYQVFQTSVRIKDTTLNSTKKFVLLNYISYEGFPVINP